jgi:hypothetical protein
MFTYCNFKWIYFQIMRVIHNMHKFEEQWKLHSHIYSSTEYKARAVWMNNASQTKIR